MKNTVSIALLSLAGLVSSANVARLSCPQATRFGILNVTPTTFKAGDTVKINVDLTCAVQNFGIVAQALDYTLEVPAPENNGFEAAIILARRSPKKGALSDSFTTKIPHGFFVANASYNIILTNIYPIAGTDGSPVVIRGGVLAPVTVNV